MAVPVLILGQSGTGKSYSMKNFNEDEICLISVQKSLLPFRKQFRQTVVTDKYNEIIKLMQTTNKKVIVIDDTQYLMCNEFMRRATEKGYDKFTEIAQNFWSLVVQEVNKLPSDTIVYLLCHTATDENGVEKMKTIGKLVDEKITPEGLFTIVLKTAVSDGNYAFVTQNNGKDTVKSPEGMFSTYAINNDLKYVDEKIRNYYGLGELYLSDEEMAEIDAINERNDIEAPKSREERKRRSRGADEGRQRKAVTSEVTYLWHDSSDEVIKMPVGTPVEEIERMVNNDCCDIVDEAFYNEKMSQRNKTEQPQTERKQRKSREEVQAENDAKREAHSEAVQEAIDEAAGDREELPFDEAEKAMASVDAPETEALPRRRRRRTE